MTVIKHLSINLFLSALPVRRWRVTLEALNWTGGLILLSLFFCQLECKEWVKAVLCSWAAYIIKHLNVLQTFVLYPYVPIAMDHGTWICTQIGTSG